MIDLICGDCLVEMDKLIAQGVKVDAVITDPPYGMGYQSNRRGMETKFEGIEGDVDLGWLDEFVDKCFRMMKMGAAIYMFCSWHHVDVFKRAFERKFVLKNIIVWVKNNHGAGDLRGSYAPKHELVLFGCKGRSLLRGKRLSDVMEFPKVPGGKMVHPTEKSVKMLEVFVRKSTGGGEIVLDPFMGRGTTMVACKKLGRRGIGIELDKKYFEIAGKRLGECKYRDMGSLFE